MQTSSMVEFLNPNALKAHPKNIEIYGDDGYQDLIQSVSELGVMQAICVNTNRVIISGHRRWLAAKAANLTQVPVITNIYATELDERQAIIEFNRYRIKSGQQLYNEGKEIEAIETEKAKGRQGNRTDLQPNIEDNCPQCSERSPQARDMVAKAIGLGSGRQWDRLSEIAEKKPELLQQIKPEGMSIHKAYAEVKRDNRKTKIAAQVEAISQLKPVDGLFDVIVIDPPWQIAGDYDPDGRRSANPYPTMSFEKIRNIKIPAADNCILWLWVTNLNMHDGLHLLDYWGFEFKNILTWAKDKFGLGVWLRGQTEHCLLATN